MYSLKVRATQNRYMICKVTNKPFEIRINTFFWLNGWVWNNRSSRIPKLLRFFCIVWASFIFPVSKIDNSIEDWQQFCNIPSSTTSYNFSNVKFCRKNVPLKKIGCFSRISIQLKSNSYLIWWKLFCLFDFDCFSKIIICEEFPEFYLCHPDLCCFFYCCFPNYVASYLFQN